MIHARSLHLAWLASVAALLPLACGDSQSALPSLSHSGGSTGSGAASSTSGGTATASVGGSSAGGTSAAGGSNSGGSRTATGGSTSVTGGNTSTIGGRAPTGGSTAGGTRSGGTTTASGGTTTSTGGSTAQGGVTTGSGGTASGGSPAGGKAAGGTTSGGNASGGNAAGGNSATGGSATGGKATGGTSTGGSASATGGVSTGGSATGGTTTTTGCGSVNNDPFSCAFGWGAPSSGSNYSYLDFVSTWVGDETNGGLSSWSATATNSSCGDCNLVGTVASTNSMVAFYTYFIGFQACKVGGFCDCNTDGDGSTLCTGGAQFIRSNRAQIIRAYGEYAKAVYAKSPNKPVIWMLEGDFIQYSYADTQSAPLSYAELGALARDITCAIKTNQPNAIVAMNHSPWIGDDQAKGFWGAQPTDVLDLIWVQGPGNTDAFVNSGTYNATTANYAWLHSYTGLKILAETSYAGSGADDRWTTTTAANINARIANGVVGVLVNNPSSNYQSAISGFSLGSTCQ